MADRSRLVRMRIVNIGPIGPEGLDVDLDNIVCLVGANNSGKSTVLRAYELALGTEKFTPERDLCKRASEPVASVEIWVHIPEGTPNIAERWKAKEDNLLLVRSRWQWADSNGWAVERQTWNPEISDYSTDDKASGLDNVFNSRLPKPFRIGTLEDPEEEHKRLLTLILQPVADRLTKALDDSDSELHKALSDFNTHAQTPVKEEEKRLKSLKDELNRSHNAIFPDLAIDFEIGLGEIDLDPVKLLLKRSHIKFVEWAEEISWTKQGTGCQRALFWTMLQVRSKLNAIAGVVEQTTKQIADAEKKIYKLKKGLETVKREDTKKKKAEEITELEKLISDLRDVDPEKVVEENASGVALPGYMLLIDEPEVALHPNAIRAARDHLYGLADDPSWQVMLSTHSPQFIDPLKDHTTIVRLDRRDVRPTPAVFRTDDVRFSDDEKDNLKMLNRFDSGLAEMFFGQFPILVEGDTEFTAFQHIMQSDQSAYPVHGRPLLVVARGKHNLALIIRMLRHFKVDFSVIHDCDFPRRKDGNSNSAWTANETIHNEITLAREKGLRVIHRVSVPNLELAHTMVQTTDDGDVIDPPSKEKPWNMLVEIKGSTDVRDALNSVFRELNNRGGREEPFDAAFKEGLEAALRRWVEAIGVKDARFMS